MSESALSFLISNGVKKSDHLWGDVGITWRIARSSARRNTDAQCWPVSTAHFHFKARLRASPGSSPRFLALTPAPVGSQAQVHAGRGARDAGIISFTVHFGVVQTSKQWQKNQTTRKCPFPAKIHCVPRCVPASQGVSGAFGVVSPSSSCALSRRNPGQHRVEVRSGRLPSRGASSRGPQPVPEPAGKSQDLLMELLTVW